MAVIGSVRFVPEAPTVGQSVKVDVLAPDGTAYENDQTPFIAIDGNPGASQFLQFAWPGMHQVVVTASGARGGSEVKVFPLVVEPPAVAAPAGEGAVAGARGLMAQADLERAASLEARILTIAEHPDRELAYGATFALRPVAALVAPLGPRGTPPADAARAAPATQLASTVPGHPAAFVAPSEATIAAAERYEWDFGDGSDRIRTVDPVADHDFEPQLGALNEYERFDVKVRELASDAWSVRTVCVVNAYAACKRRGFLVPKVVVQGWAQRAGTSLVGSAEIINRENVPITLLSRQVAPVHPESSRRAGYSRREALKAPIVVPAEGSTTVRVEVPTSSVPHGAVGFSVLFSDSPARARRSRKTDVAANKDTAADLKVRATAHFLISPADRLTPAPRVGVIGVSALRTSSERLQTVAGESAAVELEALDVVVPSTPLPPTIGSACDPDSLPPDAPSNVVCQATPEREQVKTPGMYLNAQKGDLVLAPGGNGLIGQLLNQVTPPQFYSHSGVMTKNHGQITHCTGCLDWLEDHPVGNCLVPKQPFNGFDPNAVKYIWPGAITQTVEETLESVPRVAPDNQKTYNIGPLFNAVPQAATIAGKFTVIPPLVVKPDPAVATQATLDLLSRVADEAFANTGKAHYRFYSYTDPAIAYNPANNGPPGSGWATGTFPAVCSSFIWLMMKKCGANALGPSAYATEEEFGPTTRAEGVKVEKETLDGLFLYTESSRSAAVNWLYHAVYELAEDKAGKLANFVTGVAARIGNQFCNAFVSDECASENNSTAWKAPGKANAVSPDNLLAWNGPDQGGVLGYAEPAVYASPRTDIVTVYRWAAVGASGKVTGVVTFEGQPVSGAALQLSGFYAGSAADGTYEFTDVPYGEYDLKAQIARTTGEGVAEGTQYISAQVPIRVQAPDTVQDVQLQAPASQYRRIKIAGQMVVNCSEKFLSVTFSSNTATVPFLVTIEVDPDGPHGKGAAHASCETAFSDLTAAVDLQADESVVVTLELRLDRTYGTWTEVLHIAKDGTAAGSASLSGNDDSVQLSFTGSNGPQAGAPAAQASG